jgi:pyruvate/2-oxoglutarate dehydrogenase complex dihydrolipoamide acyltransferase (E2) component
VKKELNIGSYELIKFPKARIPTLDFLTLGDKAHYIKGLIEVDVTKGRDFIRKHEKETGVKISFTAWLLKCIGKAASEHKEVHSIMKGSKRIVRFDDVDISTIVERDVNDIKVPLPLLIRKTNEKSIKEIHNEIRAAQTEKVNHAVVLGGDSIGKKMKLYVSLPKFIRRFLLKHILKNPIKVKQLMGTIVVTAVGMFGNIYGWPIPTTAHPLALGIGGITKKPGVINDQIEIREYLTMTVLLNHDIVDGAPATRFISRLGNLLKSGFSLDDLI